MIILSYQGPDFTDVRSVRLAPGLDPVAYLKSLPDGSCAMKLESPDSFRLSNRSLLEVLYSRLADEPVDPGINEALLRTGLFKLAEKACKTLNEIPDAEQPRYNPDKHERPRADKDDKWSKMTTDELEAAACAKGYVVQPAPNGGVRRMRLLNYVRKH